MDFKDFELQEFSLAVWTPEIGGVFEGLQLKLKPFLKREKNVFMRKLARENKVSPTNLMEQAMNTGITEGLTDKYLSLIEDWLGCTAGGQKVDCTTENKDKYLRPLLDYNTGHKDANGRQFTLMIYIANFTETLENYQKNSVSTAKHGNPVSVTGNGNSETTLDASTVQT